MKIMPRGFGFWLWLWMAPYLTPYIASLWRYYASLWLYPWAPYITLNEKEMLENWRKALLEELQYVERRLKELGGGK
ncbi:MAG TPA: hypothetical protein ENF41_03245 [Candidatus Bathyarchaeota archaeon]|nr:hypothetical protein [Candidatus Bathyarchaeota archaeon]